jgi:hypothetical protein
MSQQLLYLTELYLNGLKPIRKARLVRDTTLYPKPKALGVYGAISLNGTPMVLLLLRRLR